MSPVSGCITAILDLTQIKVVVVVVVSSLSNCTGIAEITGSNPIEALIFFRLLLSNIIFPILFPILRNIHECRGQSDGTRSLTHSLAHSLTHSLTHSILINLFIKPD